MVESPRIRILYDKIKFTKNKKIIEASGASYKKSNIDLIGYTIRKWWFAGKYIYFLAINNSNKYMIRTHMMMYGKITINEPVKPHLTPFLKLTLDDGTTLIWYLSQIKFIDLQCKTDLIPTNYGEPCLAKKIFEDSIQLTHYDVSHPNYDKTLHLKHLEAHIESHPNEIATDMLLDQKCFPGVGNIIQQEALYRCRILPTRLIADVDINCLVDEVKQVVDLLYQSYLDKQLNVPHKPILQIYHKAYCPLGHKTITQKIGYHDRRTTWCPICQV